MKRNELIKLLQELPEDAEIVIVKGDDVLGDYFYSDLISVNEAEGSQDERGTLWTKYSNYSRLGQKTVIVWEIS
jgi:hypothetical protein